MLATLVLFSSTLVQSQASANPALNSKLVTAIDSNYLFADTPSWQRARSPLLMDPGADTASLDRALASLNDPDLRLMTSKQMRLFQEETSGHESGIGIVDFALTQDPASGKPQIVTALVGSPAYEAGLQPEDILLEINGKKTDHLLHEDVMSMLRGDSGSVSLQVERDTAVHRITVSRSIWDEHAVISKEVTSRGWRIGYIAIRLFTSDSGAQVRNAIANLIQHGVTRCIIDLRNNPGGYLDQMAIAGNSLSAKSVGWKVRRDGTREPISSASPPSSSLHLAVLINGGTASAAEALAASLRDTEGAVLVGTKTFGRGQIQTYASLSDTEGVIIPVAEIESPSGHRFNKRIGLQPDLVAAHNSLDLPYLKALDLLAKAETNPPQP